MNNKIEKLSFEELIKSLECCTAPTQKCGECPANKYEPGECFDSVKIQAAEMLKDLKAENENLKERAIPTSGFINLLNGAHVYTKTLEEYNEFRKSIKSSVINEFAEKLKQKVLVSPYDVNLFSPYTQNLIDNLVKEMVGEDK